MRRCRDILSMHLCCAFVGQPLHMQACAGLHTAGSCTALLSCCQHAVICRDQIVLHHFKPCSSAWWSTHRPSQNMFKQKMQTVNKKQTQLGYWRLTNNSLQWVHTHAHILSTACKLWWQLMSGLGHQLVWSCKGHWLLRQITILVDNHHQSELQAGTLQPGREAKLLPRYLLWSLHRH